MFAVIACAWVAGLVLACVVLAAALKDWAHFFAFLWIESGLIVALAIMARRIGT